MLLQPAENCNDNTSLSTQTKPEDIHNKDVAIWIKFLNQLRLPDLFGKLSDHRQQSKTTYSNLSLALWGFSVAAFRQGSKNALNTTIDSMKQKKCSSMANYVNLLAGIT
jgi:uncharacterized protein YfaQ (DUF2300 family)